MALCVKEAVALTEALPPPPLSVGAGVPAGVIDEVADVGADAVGARDAEVRAEAPLPIGKEAVPLGVAAVPTPDALPDAHSVGDPTALGDSELNTLALPHAVAVGSSEKEGRGVREPPSPPLLPVIDALSLPRDERVASA